MRVELRLLLLMVAGVLAPAIVAPAPRAAAQLLTTTTTTTTPPSGGTGLSISSPPTADLGGGVTGGTIRATLGTVAVADNRSGVLAGWTATVAASAFTTGAAGPAETISPQQVRYWSGPAVTTSGVGTFTPGQLTESLAQTLQEARLAFAVTALGKTSASWSPTIIVDVPASAALGTYTGTITHSVA